MSKTNEEFELALDPDAAWLACKQAIASIGWGIASADEAQIVPRMGFGVTRNPSKIAVERGEAPADSTAISLSGSIVGFGPVQKRHLSDDVNRLRNSTEVAAATQ